MTGRTPLEGLNAIRAGDALTGLGTLLETAGASRCLLDQVADLRRLVLAELAEDPEKRQAKIDVLAETLTPEEVIRHAEMLIRRRFSPVSPLYQIWGKVADEMNSASHLPELTTWGSRMRDIRQFSNHTALAWAVIGQMHGRVPS